MVNGGRTTAATIKTSSEDVVATMSNSISSSASPTKPSFCAESKSRWSRPFHSPTFKCPFLASGEWIDRCHSCAHAVTDRPRHLLP
jgi:hypothetical protein